MIGLDEYVKAYPLHLVNIFILFQADTEVKIDAANELLKTDETKIINDFQGTIKKKRKHLSSRIYSMMILSLDRCASTKCREGETCVLNKDGDAECACITQCEDPKDERLMV